MMDFLCFISSLFNNREKALLLWLLLFIVWMLFNSSLRKSLGNLVRVLFSWKILVVFLSFFVYLGLIIFSLNKISFWDHILFKDTIYWIFSVGLVLLFKLNDAGKDNNFFFKVLKGTFVFSIIFEFALNFYTFNFYFEFILLPLLVLISLLVSFVKGNDKVKSFGESMLSLFGLVLVLFFIVNIVTDYRSFLSLETLKVFLLPLLLTTLYIPFLYLLHVLFSYEQIFVRLKGGFRKQPELFPQARMKLIKACKFSSKKLNKFSSEYAGKFFHEHNRARMDEIFDEFKNETQNL